MIELLVASAVLMLVMTSLVMVFTQTLSSTASAKERQAANELLNRTMEELRALPFSTIAKGLDNSVCSASDPSITTSTSCANANGTNWTFTPTGEVIPHADLNRGGTNPDGTPKADPLYMNTTPRNLRTIKVNATTYTLRSYVTQKTGDTGVYRVTVVASFKNPKKSGGIEQISSQSLVYSQAGCVSSTTHPFGAPCQPFFYGLATTGIGSLHATPDDPETTGVSGIQGTSLARAQIEVPEATSSLQVEQISAVSGRARASAAKIVGDSTGDLLSGNATATEKVDDDPGSESPVFLNGSINQGVVARIQLGPDDTASARTRQAHSNASDGDVGDSMTTAAALTSHSCVDNFVSPTVTMNTGLPCAASNVRQAGDSVLSFRVREDGIYLANDSFGRSTELMTIGPAPASFPNRSFSARYVTPGGAHCVTTTGDGCVYSASQRAFGTLTFGKLPSLFVSGSTPAFIARLSNYADRATAERGVNAAVPTTQRLPANGIATPKLEYWDGNNADGSYYTTVTAWPASTTALPIPAVNLTNGDWQLNITSQLSMGGMTTKVTGPADCSDVCTGAGTLDSPVSGVIHYQVHYKGNLLVDLALAVDLGTLTAEAQYRKAPSAG